MKNTAAENEIVSRLQSTDWQNVAAELDERGCALLSKIIPAEDCRRIVAMYLDNDNFRSRVVMARHGYGRGEYKYFSYPLPEVVGEIRTAVYPKLVPTANNWNEAMNIDVRYPDAHEEFIKRCHTAGQTRPTPLLLKYGEGDYNCLHQDLYGEHVFPMQMAFLLSEPNKDFTGGEFVITEQRPRMQTRTEVVQLTLGDAVIFAVHQRPIKGNRGHYRVNMRHGVSRLRSGSRYTLGVIFHDAK